MRRCLLPALLPFMSLAADYTAERTTADSIPIVRLADSARRIEVRVVPSIGNNAYSMTVNGQEILWSPYRTLAELKAKPTQIGNPLLAPWANRIDQEAYFANGRKYLLNPALGNFRLDANRQPIHGLLVFASQWQVVRVEADQESARVTSRLEFWREPDWMAQFPFAHNLEMTYRLAGGALEVETAVENLSSRPMPLSLGFHTYYRVPDAPRDQWKVVLPAADHVILNDRLTPTGERKPVSFPEPLSLGSAKLDDVFTNLARQPDGKARFSVQGRRQKISVLFGPRYPVAVVWVPPGRDFLCFEPMTGVTNAFNLAQAGKYPELQSVAPGQTWRESFWIRPEGFDTPARE